MGATATRSGGLARRHLYSEEDGNLMRRRHIEWSIDAGAEITIENIQLRVKIPWPEGHKMKTRQANNNGSTKVHTSGPVKFVFKEGVKQPMVVGRHLNIAQFVNPADPHSFDTIMRRSTITEERLLFQRKSNSVPQGPLDSTNSMELRIIDKAVREHRLRNALEEFNKHRADFSSLVNGLSILVDMKAELQAKTTPNNRRSHKLTKQEDISAQMALNNKRKHKQMNEEDFPSAQLAQDMFDELLHGQSDTPANTEDADYMTFNEGDTTTMKLAFLPNKLPQGSSWA